MGAFRPIRTQLLMQGIPADPADEDYLVVFSEHPLVFSWVLAAAITLHRSLPLTILMDPVEEILYGVPPASPPRRT